jgi:hypothetical protein
VDCANARGAAATAAAAAPVVNTVRLFESMCSSVVSDDNCFHQCPFALSPLGPAAGGARRSEETDVGIEA